jgi:DNA-binding NarL/FixJ family response regulator
VDVLIVDDHPIIHQTLAAVVRKAIPGATIHAAADLDTGLELAASLSGLGMVLLDLGLPGYSGIEALQRFRQALPSVNVVVFSATEDAATVWAALGAGARGYLPKTAMPYTVVSALQQIVRGGIYTPPMPD